MTATATDQIVGLGKRIASGIAMDAADLGAYAEGAWLVGQFIQTDDAYTFTPEDRKAQAIAAGVEPKGIEMPDAIRLLVGGVVVKVGCPDRGMLQALTQGVEKLDLLAVPVFTKAPYNPAGDRGRVGFRVRGGPGQNDAD
jgi:hypothetical protein